LDYEHLDKITGVTARPAISVFMLTDMAQKIALEKKIITVKSRTGLPRYVSGDLVQIDPEVISPGR
jgi:hypothetical protein